MTASSVPTFVLPVQDTVDRLPAPWVVVDRACVNNAMRDLTVDEVLRAAGVKK